ETGTPWWRCFGCGAHGDAATLVMKLDGVRFPEAVASLVGEGRTIGPRASPARMCPSPTLPAGSEAAVLALIETAEERLWAAHGARDRAYLQTTRGLSEATIRRFRLGSTAPLDHLPGAPRGIVLTWWEQGRPTLVKIRQPSGRAPRYREVYRRAPAVFVANDSV